MTNDSAYRFLELCATIASDRPGNIRQSAAWLTDGLPGLALAVENPERDTMRRAPYPPKEHIFGRGMALDIAWIVLLMGCVSPAMGYWYWEFDSANDVHWRAIICSVLTFAQMGNVMSIRSSHDSLFQIGLFSNRPLIGSVALTFALQMAVIYWPPLQGIFKQSAMARIIAGD